uniref:EGF-like domain-containing protein n=1 Tax=Palpitomonas bilix TaxID=652834 RepID=A0A7S3CYP8_9EUKA|mmetsp:Transcript_1500/g.2973  ORF Transcript_1500/g.2973 Transcript_1500/m.2973 type:complete len:627 (+) Transcript_1500:351-2231(+)
MNEMVNGTAAAITAASASLSTQLTYLSSQVKYKVDFNTAGCSSNQTMAGCTACVSNAATLLCVNASSEEVVDVVLCQQGGHLLPAILRHYTVAMQQMQSVHYMHSRSTSCCLTSIGSVHTLSNCECVIGANGDDCSMCDEGRFGDDCAACTVQCHDNGRCNDGRYGDNTCVCDRGKFGGGCYTAIAEQQILVPTASDLSMQLYGERVAVTDDGSTLAVSGRADVRGSNSGAVYVYKRNATGGYEEEQVIEPPVSNVSSLLFGIGGICFSQDGAMLVIGAERVEMGPRIRYVYKYEGGSYVHVQTYYPSLPQSNETRIATYSMRMVQNGKVLFLGFAESEVDGKNAVGVVEVLKWNETASLFELDEAITPAFVGEVEAMARRDAVDAVEDGSMMVTHGRNQAENSAGMVYVYVRSDTSGRYELEQTIYPPTRQTLLVFGIALALSANGGTLAVGAMDNEGAVQGGAIYIYIRTAGSNGVFTPFQSREKLVVPSPREGDAFGWNALTISPDGDMVVAGTGLREKLGGDSLIEAGSIHVFARTRREKGRREEEGGRRGGGGIGSEKGLFEHVEEVYASDASAGSKFGYTSIVMTRSNTSIDAPTLFVGAHKASAASPNSGALYVFELAN